MPQLIEVPGHGQVEFPDGMTDQQIVLAIQANAPRKIPEAALRPEANVPGLGAVTAESSGGFNPAAALIKAGDTMTKLSRGYTQMQMGPADWLRQKMGGKPNELLQAISQEQEQAKQPMADLQAVHPGSALIGDASVAAGVPWRALPAVAGMEYGSPEERLMKAGTTFLGGKLAEKGGQIASRLYQKSGQEAAQKAATNAVKDTNIATAQEAGYKTVPSVSGGSFAGRVVEGVTGKEKASQLAAVENQPVTDALVRKGLGLPEDAPLTHETMRAVRADAAAAGYDPVRQVPRVQTDTAYQAEISALTSRANNAAKDFGKLVESDVKPLADKLKSVKSFTGDSAVDAVAIFREKASDLYAQGNGTLGKAYRKAAEAIESQIDRGLAKNGAAALIPEYRAARTRMAQSFDVEKALREGQGSVDARVLGRLYGKNPGRMSGEIAQVGRAASAMPDVMGVPKSGWSNPVTAMDSGVGMLSSIIAGHPGPLLFPAARAAGRYGLMSGLGQKMLTQPKYQANPLLGGVSTALDNRMAPYIAGLLGYQASR